MCQNNWVFIVKIIAVVNLVGEDKMECNKQDNLAECTCSVIKCKNRGICCQCVKHHRENGQIPGCFFPKSAELKHNRSIEYFVEVWSKN